MEEKDYATLVETLGNTAYEELKALVRVLSRQEAEAAIRQLLERTEQAKHLRWVSGSDG